MDETLELKLEELKKTKELHDSGLEIYDTDDWAECVLDKLNKE